MLKLSNIRSRGAFSPITRERKYLTDFIDNINSLDEHVLQIQLDKKEKFDTILSLQSLIVQISVVSLRPKQFLVYYTYQQLD